MIPPTLSVIVLNYNGRQWLEGCLDAVLGQEGAPPFEVIVVDNASADGSADIVTSRYPTVHVVRNSSNLGFAAGNNAGARAAAGALLVFLNNDTRAERTWLARLAAAACMPSRPALVTSRVVFLDRPDTVDSAGDGYIRAGGAYKIGHRQSVRDHVRSREVFGACGAAFLIRRHVFEELGGFDERFFMVYEDVDLSYRARLAGYHCWYAADAEVRHAGSGTLGRMSATAVYYGQRNQEWTWLKNTPAHLLVRSAPGHVAYGCAGLLFYARRGQLAAALRGKMAALAGLPAILAARREVQRRRRVGPSAIAPWLERRWLRLKRREKGNAAAPGGGA